jgi:hypothetical protein
MFIKTLNFNGVFIASPLGLSECNEEPMVVDKTAHHSLPRTL